jgi:peptide/nickel transport system permease protein
VIGFFVRRAGYAAVTLLLAAFFTFGIMRLLRPDRFGPVGGTWDDVNRNLVHLEMLDPETKQMWLDGLWADLYLLAGGVVLAVVIGVLGGVWCASRPRSLASRVMEGGAMLFLCTPPYVLALGTLLLFAPPFGIVQLPYFFDPHSYQPPLEHPWDFVRSMAVPWVVVALPFAASILRLTLALTIDSMGEPFVDTAWAKGLSRARVVRRHAAPPSLVTVASLFGASAPIMVTNVVLVEWVFSIPGFFRHMRRALGQGGGIDPSPMPEMLQAISLWAAMLIVVMSFLGDLAIMRLDPQVRAGGKPIG